MSIKAVSFDLDGTLTYFNRSAEQFYSTVLQRLGFDFSAEQISAVYNDVQKWWRKRFVSGKPRTRRAYLEYNHRFLKGLGVKDDLEELSERMQSVIESMTEDLDDRLYPEVKEVLETLRKERIRLAVVSHRSLALILQSLRKHGLEEYFHCVVSPEIAGASKGKLSPEMWQFVLTKLEINPDESMHVDDDYEWLLGARIAGIQTVLVDRKSVHTSITDCIIIRDLTEILKLLS